MRQLTLPLEENTVRELKAGEQLLLSGILYTGRDAVHKYLTATPDPGLIPDLSGAVLYHCGPVVVPQEGGGWQVVAAGPTTSIREEPYEAAVIEQYHLRGIIGKGGMGTGTLDACRKFGCVYMTAVGGAAQILAHAIVRVENVYLLEKFGAPEAIWQLMVRDFPVVVTMDAHGNSLHQQVQQHSEEQLAALI